MNTIELETGKVYDLSFFRGRYEIDYAKNATCIKITKKMYRLELPNGKEIRITQGSIIETKDVTFK